MEFQLNFCEYNRQNPPYDRIYRPNGSGDYLFLLLKTPMKFHLEHQLCLTREHACILYTPQAMQHYEAVHKFLNSYIHFQCPEHLVERFGLPLNQIFYPWNYDEIDEYICRIQEESISEYPFAKDKQYFLLGELLIAAARGLEVRNTVITENQELFQTFNNLRFDMLRHYEKQWTTDHLCSMVNLEKSQFFAYYQKFFHSTPHADLLQVRMEKARNLLTNQALPISLVAEQCGFTDSAHFSRYFRKELGCSPREYAKRQR